MENASKALIIAGAILLSISIIGIGMYVFNMASESMSGVGLDAEQIAAYNSKFDKYNGTQRGSTVKTLCDTVRNHNLAEDDESQKVTLVSGSNTGNDTTTINTIKTGVLSGKSYTVTLGYDEFSGLITTITITQKSTN